MVYRVTLFWSWLLTLLVAGAIMAGCANTPASPQGAINESRALVIAAADEISAQVAVQLMSRDQAQRWLGQVREINGDLDRAQEYLDVGSIEDAKQRTAVARALLYELQAQLRQRRKDAK